MSVSIGFVTPIIQAVGLLVEYVGIIIVVVAIVIALYHLPQKKYARGKIRSELAHNVTFGLEFIIAADILLVTVATSFNEILQLGGIVLIRILLGYTLRKETLK